MKQKYWFVLTLILLATSLYGLYATFDTATSLEDARAHNRTVVESCQLLAKIAQPGFKNLTESDVRKLVGSDVSVELEGSDLWVGDLIFRLEEGRVGEVDLTHSCPSPEPGPAKAIDGHISF